MTAPYEAIEHQSPESCARARQVLAHWSRLNESLSTVRAQSYGKVAGMIWAMHCDESEIHVRRVERTDGIVVCGSCGALWPLEEAIEPASQHAHTSLGAGEESLLERHEVLRIVESAYQAEKWGVLVCIALQVNRLSWRALCRYGREHWTDARFGWNLKRLYRLKPVGETAIALAADRAGWGLD